MDDALETYISKKATKSVKGKSLRDYRKNVERVTVTIAKEIREGNRLASRLRVSGSAATRRDR